MKKGKRANREHGLIAAIAGLVSLFIVILMAFRLGWVGEVLDSFFLMLFGSLRIPFVIYACFWGVLFLLGRKLSRKFIEINICIGLVFLAAFLWASLQVNADVSGFSAIGDFFTNYSTYQGAIHGGFVGVWLFAIVSQFFDRMGTYVILIFLLIGGFLVVYHTKLPGLFHALKNLILEKFYGLMRRREEKKAAKAQRAMEVEEEEEDEIIEIAPSSFQIPEVHHSEEVQEAVIVEETQVEADIQAEAQAEERVAPYRLPNVSLLKTQSGQGVNRTNAKFANDNAQKLVEILETFNIKATISEIHVGPSVTKFEIKPELGVKVSRIASLQNDIKMALAAKELRIEAPIPGKSAVGIEIPNPDKTMVFMKDLLKSTPAKYENSTLLFALGKNLMGENIYGELNKMPHLLIAGATGSGKSVCVNSIITSILMRATPEEVQLLLIDPKKVEFTPFKEIPHLIGPVITDPKDASNALKVIVTMMDERYDVFAKLGVRNLDGYKALLSQPDNELKPMPHIVVIVDELADLMLVASKEVEASIQRITQLARAAGIHLIVATQRPSVDVITGVIKANIPSRIAFAVSSAIDSRTILDQIGAEKLLGFGDMLYQPIGENVVQRVQGVYVSDAEVQSICDYVKKQGKPKYNDAFAMLELVAQQGNVVASGGADVLYEEVKLFVIDANKASTSLIQRKFSIGYARAARMMDLLEQNGVIGPSRGSKPREIFMKRGNEVDE